MLRHAGKGEHLRFDEAQRGKFWCKWIHFWQVLFLPRFIKKLEHSWKALVYDGVSRTWHHCLYEWAFFVWRHTLTSPLPVRRTPFQCTGLGFTPAASSSSWAHGSSGRISVSVQVQHRHKHTHTHTGFEEAHMLKKANKGKACSNGKREILAW